MQSGYLPLQKRSPSCRKLSQSPCSLFPPLSKTDSSPLEQQDPTLEGHLRSGVVVEWRCRLLGEKGYPMGGMGGRDQFVWYSPFPISAVNCGGQKGIHSCMHP